MPNIIINILRQDGSKQDSATRTFRFQTPRTVGEMDPEVWQIQDCIGLIHKKSEEIQINSSVYAMGDSTDDVLTTFVFHEEGDDLKYDKVKEKFDQYFTVRRNVIYERAKFNKAGGTGASGAAAAAPLFRPSLKF